MLSLISTLGGLLISGLPKVLDFFQNKSDQAHEIALARLQNEMQLQLAAQGFAAQAKIEEIRTDQVAMQSEAKMTEAALQHDAKVLDKASKWAVNYVATVRPTVTYIFVLELVLINMGLVYFLLFKQGLGTLTVDQFIAATDLIFSEDEMAMLGGIVGYWFGSRGWSKK
jgi:hypothetical protein